MSAATEFDVIAIGDTTQDVFLKMSDASVQCDVDGENCKIMFDYADKIAVEQKTDVPAVGNAANHAIGIARLEHRAAVYTIVGDDVQGHLAQDVFNDNGVDGRYVTFDKENGTNFSCVVNFKGERTIFVYHEPRDYQLPELGTTKWVYLTSASGDGVDSLHEQMLRWLTANPDVKLAFNPGTHQMHLGRKKLEPLLARTDLLFLNREEAAEVLEVDTSDIAVLMSGYRKIGTKDIVLTDGPEGSYASEGNQIHYSGIYDGPVIERTGAGDSFGSGFLSALLAGEGVPDAMQWGNANSTSVVQYIGAREGLLTRKGIKELRAKNPKVTSEKFATLT